MQNLNWRCLRRAIAMATVTVSVASFTTLAVAQREDASTVRAIFAAAPRVSTSVKGVTVFAVIDHSGEAKKAGMTMRPTKLVVFGSPTAGTPLMLAAPSIAIDLPLKILVAEDDQGKVFVSYNSPAYLGERHGLPENLLQNIALVESLAASVGA